MIPHEHTDTTEKPQWLLLFRVFVVSSHYRLYRITQLLPHLSDIIKLVNNGLLIGSMHCGRSKRKCTVSPVDCNVSV